MTDFLDLSKQAFDSSTAYVDANFRADWEYSLKAFRNEHGPGSRYLDSAYQHRSRLFRPKTRSIIRKNEAAAAVALFSNMDVVDLTAGNPDDIMNVASAACMKEILEYRLSKTIQAFPLVMGAVQDAQTTGVVVSYNYWEYATKKGKKVKDKPCIELRPIENIRMDAGASWIDPVNTSPYWADIIPMYVCDVKAMMSQVDDKTDQPKWKKYEDSAILQARPDIMDTTRRARLGTQQDPQIETSSISAFDMVWVLRWFMKDSQGDDFTYYTLGTNELLTDAKPLEEVYFHGKRPYTMGYAVLETHKALKSSLPMLIKPLQQEVNNIANQRMDNVSFVLNKRWLVARGRQTDVQSLVRNVPGGVTLTSDPKNDIVESNWPDVTSSAFVEQDRLNSELDDLAGNFSPSTKVANNAVNDTLGGSRMAQQGAGLMSDYLLRTIIETWWEPTLRHLVLLEQEYETDEIILEVCAKKARLFPKFGISRITDQLLMNEVNVSVNVGMGSSDPNQRFQKFLMTTESAIKMVAEAPPSFNVQEAIKELYSNAGYRDGARFWNDQVDPRLGKAMQMIQQLQGQLKSKQMEIQAQGQIEQMKVQSAEKQKMMQLQIDDKRISGDLQLRQSELGIQGGKLQIEAAKVHHDANKQEPPANPLKEEADIAEVMASVNLKTAQADLARTQAGVANQTAAATTAKTSSEIQKTTAEIQTMTTDKEQHQKSLDDIKSSQQAVLESMQETFNKASADQSKAIQDITGKVHQMGTVIANVASTAVQPKRKATGFTLKKGANKKTVAVLIHHDDGTTDTMPVN